MNYFWWGARDWNLNEHGKKSYILSFLSGAIELPEPGTKTIEQLLKLGFQSKYDKVFIGNIASFMVDDLPVLQRSN